MRDTLMTAAAVASAAQNQATDGKTHTCMYNILTASSMFT